MMCPHESPRFHPDCRLFVVGARILAQRFDPEKAINIIPKNSIAMRDTGGKSSSTILRISNTGLDEIILHLNTDFKTCIPAGRQAPTLSKENRERLKLSMID